MDLIVKKHKVYFSQETKQEYKLLKSVLTKDDPNAPYIKSSHYRGKIKFYNPKMRYFYIGFLDLILEAFDQEGHSINLFEPKPDDLNWVEFGPSFQLDERDYQRESILSFFQYKYGFVEVPTRGGKNFIAGEAIRLLMDRNPSYKFLFVCDFNDGFNQSRKDISSVVGCDFDDIGVIREKRVELDKPITVAMIQTLNSILKPKSKRIEDKKQLVKYIKSINVLIVDEIQEFTSKSRAAFVKRCFDNHLDYSLGLSATPWEDDLMEMRIRKIFGQILYTVDESKLQQNEVIAFNKVMLILNKKFKSDLISLRTYDDHRKAKIVFNEIRNGIILKLIKILIKLKIKTLVVFDLINHGMLIEQQSGCFFLHGEHTDEEREKAKSEFLKGRGKVLLVSNIFKKGITLPEAEVLLNAGGGKSKTMTIQKRGRVLGLDNSGVNSKALCIDFIDLFTDYFSDHSLNRLVAYESRVGEEKIEIYDSESNDFWSDIENNLKQWFYEYV